MSDEHDNNLMPVFGRAARARDAAKTDENEKALEEMARRHGIAPPASPPVPALSVTPTPVAVRSDSSGQGVAVFAPEQHVVTYLQPYRRRRKDVPPGQSTQMTLRGPASVLNRFKAYCDLDMRGKAQWEVLDDLLDRVGAPTYEEAMAAMSSEDEGR